MEIVPTHFYCDYDHLNNGDSILISMKKKSKISHSMTVYIKINGAGITD